MARNQLPGDLGARNGGAYALAGDPANVGKALLLALDCPPDRVEDVFALLRGQVIPDTPQGCIDAACTAMDQVLNP